MGKKIKHKHGRPTKNSRILTRESIVETSFALAKEVGIENLSMKLIAEHLEIRPPSIYNHISDIIDVKLEVATLTLKKLAQALRDSVELDQAATEDRILILKRLLYAYRKFAKENSGVYQAVLPSVENNPIQKVVSQELIQICMNTLGLKMPLDQDGVHKIRILRSTLHGFVSLEAADGFGLSESVDETFDRLCDNLCAILLA